jgi:hypothetical protein
VSKNPNVREYRGFFIEPTTDQKLLQGNYNWYYGFSVNQGYVVRDALGEDPMPITMPWFYTPLDARMAIDALMIPENEQLFGSKFIGPPGCTYYVAMRWRTEFVRVMQTFEAIDKLCREGFGLYDAEELAAEVRKHIAELGEYMVRNPEGMTDGA